MGYLQDYQLYLSGTECPRSFVLWSSLALMGAVCGRRVWVKSGDYFNIYPNLYVALVGDSGSGKSVPRIRAVQLLHLVWPEYPISADIQSHQHICRKMASTDGAFTWKNGSGKIEISRPFFAVPDELPLFLGTDMKGMMAFMVGVHTSEGFATGFKVEEDLPQYIENPYFSVLGCAVPDWFMNNLKMDLFTGGAGRRFIIVHDHKTVLRPRPAFPPGAVEAYQRIINHLQCLREYHGCSVVDPAAYAWWDNWYLSRDKWAYRDNPIISQFHSTKPDMVLRVALLLSLNEMPFQQVIREEHLRLALGFLDELEPKVIRLTAGIGRNVLAGMGAELMEKLELNGGQALEKRFRMMFYRHLRDQEWEELITHYTGTNELVRISCPDPSGVVRLMLFLPTKYDEIFCHVCKHCGQRYIAAKVCCGYPTSPLSPSTLEGAAVPTPEPSPDSNSTPSASGPDPSAGGAQTL